ncbi:MAG TPA: VWA domain-containing protein [Terriglobales bacterium]|nr:VWA domain-containing protein [Terriglobales bacterium]
MILSLTLAILLLSVAARSQSQDEVHVVPRNPSHLTPEDATGPNREGLDAHTKPVRADVDLVLVPVVVTDAMNSPVLNLKKDDFAIDENDERQQIQFFSKEDAPISVGMILDFSKSMSNKFEAERAAVTEFFKNANPADDYFAIAISDRPHLIADSTQSIDDLEQKLAMAIPAGNTALLDAIYLGVTQMRFARYRRRALLIISDGGDNHSYYNERETKALAQEADVLMYSIGIFDNMPVPVFKTIEEKLGKRLLTGITELTGGRTVAADDRDKIPEIAAALSRELREQYLLAYRSTHPLHDGKWRKIRVQVIAPDGAQPLHVHYKKGYLTPEN